MVCGGWWGKGESTGVYGSIGRKQRYHCRNGYGVPTLTDSNIEIEIDAIWRGDLLDRKSEATALIGYLETAFDTQLISNNTAFTLAIDARYGHGKTFFLQRLAKQLALNHPVALIDAWTDDLADEPLIALIATLKEALSPYIEKSSNIQSKWKGVLQKTGDVAKIAAKGAFKRGVGMLITAGAVEAAEHVIAGISEEATDAVNANLEDLGKQAVEGASSVLNDESSQGLMERRVREFEAGKQAIDALKVSVYQLISSLENEKKSAPIFIIIDELDRCRPTYAIKLLEEIKHLFDVKGLTFIFGMHGQQLSHSINAVYGSNFDGSSYLRRFIQRRYTLAEPDLKPLVLSLINSSGFDASKITFPRSIENGQRNQKSNSQFISSYMTAYGLTARDAYEFIDILKTVQAIMPNSTLIGPYLLPLAIGQLKRLESGRLPAVIIEQEWKLLFNRPDSDPEEISIGAAAERYLAAAQMQKSELIELKDSNDPIVRSVARPIGEWDELEADSVKNYPNILSMVRRFK